MTLLQWLNHPISVIIPTASWGDVIWLTFSLCGLVFTTWNLADALAAERWRRRALPQDRAMCEVARAHVQKALIFVAIDVICVVLGIGAVINAPSLAMLLVTSLLLVRILLPAVALRDLRLRRRVFALGQRWEGQENKA